MKKNFIENNIINLPGYIGQNPIMTYGKEDKISIQQNIHHPEGKISYKGNKVKAILYLYNMFIKSGYDVRFYDFLLIKSFDNEVCAEYVIPNKEEPESFKEFKRIFESIHNNRVLI